MACVGGDVRDSGVGEESLRDPTVGAVLVEVELGHNSLYMEGC